mgnify:CR=1 FL=1
MSAAEVWFLRAEAALRGYTSEDVENCYKQGITVSFSQWDANGVSDYLESEETPAAYVDAFDKKFDADAPTSIAHRRYDSPRILQPRLQNGQQSVV